MVYQIEIHRNARDVLRALPAKTRLQIGKVIDEIANDPFLPGSKALKGKLKSLRRARIGDYRIIYEVKNTVRVVLIVRIAHRREAYR